MPLLTVPSPVDAFLSPFIEQGVHLLIIAENYPGATWKNYFYRNLFPGFPPNPTMPRFTNAIGINFHCLGATDMDTVQNFCIGTDTAAFNRGNRILIDALPHGAPPAHPINAARLNDLVADIHAINPRYILILPNGNLPTVQALLAHPGFGPYVPTLVPNPNHTVHHNIFPYPAAPAPPGPFFNALNAARAAGTPI